MTAETSEYVGDRQQGRLFFQGFWSDSGLLNPWLYRIVRLTLAVIFLWSGTTKLFHPTSFAVIIDSYGLVPESWNIPVGVLLAAMEALVGFALVFDIRGALAALTTLLCLFMAILGYGVWLGLDIDCGCFGPEDPEAEAYHGLRPALIRDSVMVLGAAYLYLWRYGRSTGPVSISHWINQIIDRRGK